MSTNRFIVLKASAGSGKTYALVKQFLLLALKSDSAKYYRNILAITFTNAAAAEMKERVMLRLKEFTAPNHTSPLSDEICNALSISREQLLMRAERTYRDMLHHYGQLSILTIDSFTHRLIRSFARDLHLSHDFHIEMEEMKFLEKLIDQCLDNIGVDKDLTQYLTDHVFESLEENKSWNFRDNLIKTSKLLLNDETANALKRLEDFGLEDFALARKKLLEKNKTFERHLISQASAALSIIENAGISLKEFAHAGSGTTSVLTRIKKNDFEKIPGPNFHKWIANDNWSAGKTSPEVKKRIQSIRGELMPFVEEIASYYSNNANQKYQLRGKILSNLYAIGLLRSLGAYAAELKQSENTLLISDFQRIVHEIITQSDAPFIYERIGNRYKHILFDEFQDTSLLQWSNTIPLIVNSLSENNLNLVVGDAKQSIYRWRGGFVEQFINLPNVPLSADHAQASLVFKNHILTDHLHQNRRSTKEIVQFNNKFYELLAKHLEEYQKVYDDTKQEVVRKNEGYVEITLSKEKSIQECWTHTSESILKHIRDSLNDGFKHGDIAILVRKGAKDGGKIAELLLAHGYQVVTRESFLLQNSPVVRVVMAFLDYSVNTTKHFAAIDLVQSLALINDQIKPESFLQTYSQRSGKKTLFNLTDFLKTNFGDHSLLLQGANTFQNVMNILKYFKLDVDTGMEFLLEKIKHQCIGRNMALPEFLVWWNDSKDKLCTAASENVDAINILTIHKSKGLQFPVVIYPRFATTDDTNDVWVNLDESEYHLPTAYVRASQKDDDESEVSIAFKEEKSRQLLDEVNVCYVATTRAEERLYIIQEDSSKNTILSKKIIEILESDFPPFKETGVWTSGNKVKVQSNKTAPPAETVRISRGRMLSPELKVIPASERKSHEREFGTLIHLCLAEMQNEDDVESGVLRVCNMHGIHSDPEVKQIMDNIKSIFEYPAAKKWFLKENISLREKDICTANGEILRPDRVVLFQDRIEIVDFKTGIHQPAYEVQIRKYKKHLSELFTLPVKGFLFFTQNGEYLEVD